MSEATDGLRLLTQVSVEEELRHRITNLESSIHAHQQLTERFKRQRDAARAQAVALREIAAAVATVPLVYVDEHLEYECPFPAECSATVNANWGNTPRGMDNREWAERRIKHDEDCPILKARAMPSAAEDGTSSKRAAVETS